MQLLGRQLRGHRSLRKASMSDARFLTEAPLDWMRKRQVVPPDKCLEHTDSAEPAYRAAQQESDELVH